MSRHMRVASIVGLVGLCGTCVLAAPFDPVFQIASVEGECLVSAPGEAAFAPAERGKAYPYGTRLRTGKGGTCTIAFSDKNACTLSPSCEAHIYESKLGKTAKVVSIAAGKAEFALEQGYEAANRVHVRTPVAACEAVAGGTFTVEALKEGAEANIAKFTCQDGQLAVTGPNFAVKIMEKGDVFSVSTAPDNSFTRLVCEQGQFTMCFKDSENNPKEIEAKPGTVVKIWRRVSESGKMLIVTILITRDQQLEEAITYIDQLAYDMGPAVEELVPGAEVTTTTRATATTTVPPTPPEWAPLGVTPTTTTTTSTTKPGFVPPVVPATTVTTTTRRRTTTTTKPSPTPVGSL